MIPPDFERRNSSVSMCCFPSLVTAFYKEAFSALALLSMILKNRSALVTTLTARQQGPIFQYVTAMGLCLIGTQHPKQFFVMLQISIEKVCSDRILLFFR